MRPTGPLATDSRLQGRHWHWVVALLFFVVGDAVTTGAGLGVDGVVEAGPVTAPVLDAHGVGGLVFLKLLVVGGALLGWRLIPRPYCVGIPLGLSIVGFFATVWNVHVLAQVLL